MIHFFLNHFPAIIFGVVALILAFSESKKYMARKNMNWHAYSNFLQEVLSESSSTLLLNGVTSTLVTSLISMVSFREFWVNDVFHVVFLTSLLFMPIKRYLRRTFQ